MTQHVDPSYGPAHLEFNHGFRLNVNQFAADEKPATKAL
jgi:hypothetical protein